MRCRNAITLIDASQDTQLTPRQSELLARHLAHCPRCRAYAARLQSLARALKEDATISAHADLPPDFANRLLARLSAEALPARHIHIAQSEPALPTRLSLLGLSTRYLRLAASAAVFALTAVLLVLLAGRIPPPSPTPFAPARLASFTVRTAPDGRVYAALTQRTAEPRCLRRKEQR